MPFTSFDYTAGAHCQAAELRAPSRTSSQKRALAITITGRSIWPRLQEPPRPQGLPEGPVRCDLTLPGPSHRNLRAVGTRGLPALLNLGSLPAVRGRARESDSAHTRAPLGYAPGRASRLRCCFALPFAGNSKNNKCHNNAHELKKLLFIIFPLLCQERLRMHLQRFTKRSCMRCFGLCLVAWYSEQTMQTIVCWQCL